MAVQGKNIESFDHVKHDLNAGEGGEEADGLSNIKTEGMSEDMQRMMNKLNTPAAAKVHIFIILRILCNANVHMCSSGVSSVIKLLSLEGMQHWARYFRTKEKRSVTASEFSENRIRCCAHDRYTAEIANAFSL